MQCIYFSDVMNIYTYHKNKQRAECTKDCNKTTLEKTTTQGCNNSSNRDEKKKVVNAVAKCLSQQL